MILKIDLNYIDQNNGLLWITWTVSFIKTPTKSQLEMWLVVYMWFTVIYCYRRIHSSLNLFHKHCWSRRSCVFSFQFAVKLEIQFYFTTSKWNPCLIQKLMNMKQWNDCRHFLEAKHNLDTRRKRLYLLFPEVFFLLFRNPEWQQNNTNLSEWIRRSGLRVAKYSY